MPVIDYSTHEYYAGPWKEYEYWEECVKKIEQHKIDEAIEYALETALKLGVSQELIDRIFAVNLQTYEKRIEQHLIECIQLGKQEGAEVLLLYYSLDNGWDSHFIISRDYSPIHNDWWWPPIKRVEIGKARGFSGIYKKEAESAFYADDISTGICVLLMLRTTLAFYNVAVKYKDCGLKLCVTCTESDFVVVE